MENKLYFNSHSNSYFKIQALSELINIKPFLEQRDLDNSRVKILEQKYDSDFKRRKNFFFDTPLTFLKSPVQSAFLFNKDNERVNNVIVDRQHRLQALINIRTKYKKIGNLEIPICVHVVESLEEARIIQYNLFEQKPVDDYDKIIKSKYNLAEMFDKFLIIYQKNFKNIVERCFREGKYGA